MSGGQMANVRGAKKMEREWLRREEQKRKKLEQRKRDEAKTQTNAGGIRADRRANRT